MTQNKAWHNKDYCMTCCITTNPSVFCISISHEFARSEFKSIYLTMEESDILEIVVYQVPTLHFARRSKLDLRGTVRDIV